MEAMWFGHTSCPVVGPILGVDHHRDVLDEAVFLLAEDVGEVGSLLSTAVHGLTEVHPGGGEPVAGGVVVVPAPSLIWLTGTSLPSSNINSLDKGDSCRADRRQQTALSPIKMDVIAI